jgi:hypothetical protein
MNEGINKIGGISEVTANLLFEALKNFAAAPPFKAEELKPVVRSFILRACYDLYYKKADLSFKISKSTVFTRWFYKRKFSGVCENLKKAEQCLRNFDHE